MLKWMRLIKFFILFCAGLVGIFLAQNSGINQPVFSMFNTLEGSLLNEYMFLHMQLIQGFLATIIMIIVNKLVKTTEMSLLLCSLHFSVIVFVLMTIRSYGISNIAIGMWYMKNHYLTYLIGLLAAFGLLYTINIAKQSKH